VVIGKNVQVIEKQAFFGCKMLKNIKIKTSKLVKVGNKAFKGISRKAKFKLTKKIYKDKSVKKKYKNLIKRAGFKKVKI